jgi:hypothetical protein
MSADLNLLPSQAKFQAAKIHLKQRIMTFIWIFGGFWLLLVFVVFVVFFGRQLVLAQSDKKLKSEQTQYKAMAGDAVLSYQIKYQAKLVGKVLTDRFEYGNSIQKIKNLFTGGIVLTDFKIDTFKVFTVEGTVIEGNYMDDVEILVKSINNGDVEGFKSAKLNSVGIDKDGKWVFIMEVVLT